MPATKHPKQTIQTLSKPNPIYSTIQATGTLLYLYHPNLHPIQTGLESPNQYWEYVFCFLFVLFFMDPPQWRLFLLISTFCLFLLLVSFWPSFWLSFWSSFWLSSLSSFWLSFQFPFICSLHRRLKAWVPTLGPPVERLE